MITGQDIIVTSLQSWDIDSGSNCNNILLEFALYDRVLYVNSPLDRATILRNGKGPKVRKRIDILKEHSEDLIHIGNNIRTLYSRTILESINKIHSKWIFRNNK